MERSHGERKVTRERTRPTRAKRGRFPRCLVLILFALWMTDASAGIQQAGTSDTPIDSPEAPLSGTSDSGFQAWPEVLGWGVVLVLAFVFAALTICVFSRRFRTYLFRGTRTPTSSEDAWSMHKLPEPLDQQGAEDEDGGSIQGNGSSP